MANLGNVAKVLVCAAETLAKTSYPGIVDVVGSSAFGRRQITLMSATNIQLRNTMTEANGTWTFVDVPDGRYYAYTGQSREAYQVDVAYPSFTVQLLSEGFPSIGGIG